VTDDEAFIRAIVATPGDDAPRLVYADWLDERGDPRRAYLRASVAWSRRLHQVETREKAERQLRHVSRSLDSVWVARVTVPPIGICCDRVHMIDCGRPIPPSRIDELEARLKFRLPAAYRALLLNYNGGTPQPDVYQIGYGHFSRIQAFFSLGEELIDRSGEVSDDSLDSYAERALMSSGLQGLFPIAAFVDSHRAQEDFEKEVERSMFAYPADEETCLCVRLDTGEILRAHVDLSPSTPHWRQRYALSSQEVVASSLPVLLSQLDDVPDGWEPYYW
jgi:uncharacterized protein (TIGR02996 family)